MKNHSLEEFISTFTEEELWKIIDDYETWKETGTDANSLFRNFAREYCLNLSLPSKYHSVIMSNIAMCAYRYFALKYKETQKETN